MAVKDRRVKILATDIPISTRICVDQHAQAHDLSRNEVVIEALADRYRISLPPDRVRSRYRPSDTSRDGPWSLEVPARLRAKLRHEAAEKDATISGLIRLTLAEKFGLDVEDPGRKRRT